MAARQAKWTPGPERVLPESAMDLAPPVAGWTPGIPFWRMYWSKLGAAAVMVLLLLSARSSVDAAEHDHLVPQRLEGLEDGGDGVAGAGGDGLHGQEVVGPGTAGAVDHEEALGDNPLRLGDERAQEGVDHASAQAAEEGAPGE